MTSVIFPLSLLQVGNKLFQLVNNLEQATRTQFVDGFLTDVQQDKIIRFLRVYSYI